MNAKISVFVICVEAIIYLSLYNILDCTFKGALSGLRQFLATENSLKLMKNAFYFISKALFVLKISNFCFDFLVM